MKTINKKVIEAIENLGWIVREYGEEYELEQSSPAGEDIVEYIRKGEDIVSQVWDIYHNFDEEEHVEMWVNARHNVSGVPSISTLVKDSEEITEMYRQLALAVEKAVA